MDRLQQQFSSFVGQLNGSRQQRVARHAASDATVASATYPSSLSTSSRPAAVSVATDEAPDLMHVSTQLQMLRQRVRDQTRETTRPYTTHKPIVPQIQRMHPSEFPKVSRIAASQRRATSSSSSNPTKPQHHRRGAVQHRSGHTLVEKAKSGAYVNRDDAGESKEDVDELQDEAEQGSAAGDNESDVSSERGHEQAEEHGHGHGHGHEQAEEDSLYIAESRRRRTHTRTTVEQVHFDDSDERDAAGVASAAAAASATDSSEVGGAGAGRGGGASGAPEEERKRGRSQRRTVTTDSDVTVESRKPRRDKSPVPEMDINMRHLLDHPRNETARELYKFMETVAGSDRMIDRKTHRVKWTHVSELFDFSDPLERLGSYPPYLTPENYFMFYQDYLTGVGRSIMKRAYELVQEVRNPYLMREPLLLWLLIKNVELSPKFLELAVWCLQITNSGPAWVSVSELAVENAQQVMLPAYKFFANVSVYFENVHGMERQVWRLRSPEEIEAAEEAERERSPSPRSPAYED